MSQLRHQAARDLTIAVNSLLPLLDMPEKSVEVNVCTDKRQSLKVCGWDTARALTPMPDGAELAAVEHVFSSGELARLALSMESSTLMSGSLEEQTAAARRPSARTVPLQSLQGECLLVSMI